MAKRRRLTPAQPDYLSAVPSPSGTPALRAGIGAPPPIAQVASEASAMAALREISGALDAARAEGRLLLRLPLEAIEADYLVRDRLVADEEDLGHLMSSIAEHGQRSPIEVAEFDAGRYGLISGWRRLTALTRLARDKPDRFGTVLAQVRRPDTAASAYIAMVEENEVRSGLSYYERARVTAKAVEAGVFPTEKAALQQLFSAASRARRSKIGSFLTIHRHLDGALRFPAALPERLGLALARFLEADPTAGHLLRSDLSVRPAASVVDEQSRLSYVVTKSGKTVATEPDSTNSETVRIPGGADAAHPTPLSFDTRELRPGLFLRIKGDPSNPSLELSGPALGPTLRDRLEVWLTTQL